MKMIFPAFLMTAMLFLCACEKEGDDPSGSNSSLLGTWEYVNESGYINLEFRSGNKLVHSIGLSGMDPAVVEYTYQSTGDRISVFVSGVQIHSASYEIVGNTLITDLLADNEISYTK